jgi:uncharacterized protein YkwD
MKGLFVMYILNKQNFNIMVKLITVIFFTINAVVCIAQSTLDTLIFDKVNEYRAENCLSPLKWSNEAYTVAKNQAEYCSRIKYVLHDQTDSTVNDSVFNIEPEFEKRFTKCGIQLIGKDWTIAENLSVYVDTTDNYTMPLEKIAKKTISGWKTSPGHNAMMLMPNLDYSSIANVISDKYVKTVVDVFTLIDYTITVSGKAYYVAMDAYK